MTSPDENDDKLWQAVVKDVAPLSGRRRASATKKSTAAKPGRRRAAKPAAPPPATPMPAKKSPDVPPLVMGPGAGVDKRTTQRLKRGQLAIEGRLDLHGLTQAAAHARLDRFLASSQERGLRCVLVITGKGRVSEEGGVLRQMVPRWLNIPPSQGRVLSMSQAQPKDGGGGALYLLLRKRR